MTDSPLSARPVEKPKPAPAPAAPKAALKAPAASSNAGKQWDGPSLSDEAVTSSGPKASGDAAWGGAAPKEVTGSIEKVVDEIKEEVETVPAAAESSAPASSSDSKAASTEESSSSVSPAAESESTPEAAAPAPAAAAPAAAAPTTSAPPPGLEEPSAAPAALPQQQQKKQPAKSQANRFRSHGDEAVVMPGGVGSGVGKVGMQFGSLSLDGEGQIYEQPSACVPVLLPWPSMPLLLF